MLVNIANKVLANMNIKNGGGRKGLFLSSSTVQTVFAVTPWITSETPDLIPG